jgi:hypothetical protein
LDLRTDEKLILEFIEQEVEVQREVSALQIEVEEFIYFLNQPMGRGRFRPFHFSPLQSANILLILISGGNKALQVAPE